MCAPFTTERSAEHQALAHEKLEIARLVAQPQATVVVAVQGGSSESGGAHLSWNGCFAHVRHLLCCSFHSLLVFLRGACSARHIGDEPLLRGEEAEGIAPVLECLVTGEARTADATPVDDRDSPLCSVDTVQQPST